MNKWIVILCCLSAFAGAELHAQELFIQEEPASTIPKGVIGVRTHAQIYPEPGGFTRGMTALRLQYGLTPRLTLMATATASNHHSKDLPPDFPDHNTPQIGVPLPWRFNGVNLYGKFRFYSKDGPRTHFRAAAYATASWLNVAHDEAEPNLMDDTRGIGAGIIATYLKNHFAISFTGGCVLPADYRGSVPDLLPSLPSIPARVRYGTLLNYSLSFGYLLFPRKYSSYRQTNINLYGEFLGRSHSKGQVFFDNINSPGRPYEIRGNASPVFLANSYVEFHPGVQAIIRSNLRIDVSAGFPFLGRSLAHYYPLFTVGVQRYFY